MDTKEISILLETLLDLERKVVGVKFLHTEKEYLEFNVREISNKMTYCTIVRKATQGDGIKFKEENMACSAGGMAVGLKEEPEGLSSGVERFKLGAYEDLGVSRKVSSQMTYCQHKGYGTVVMPLEMFDENPEVAIIVGTPFQTMRISQGYTYRHGQIKNVTISGMQAVCQELTAVPFEKDRINISFMCAGTRMLAGWKESELGVGVPYRYMEDIVQGLIKTVNPLERNKRKKIIEENLARNGLSSIIQIEYNKNYDDGSYIGGMVEEKDN